jgi:asparagine synthase (glutamine-hydrolysing)
VEARVPYLDDAVVEHALSLPPWAKMRVLREKTVLREAARGLLPDSIVNRHKHPFRVPIARWFFDRPPDFVDDALSKRAVGYAGLFDAAAVARLRTGLANAARDHIDRFRHELVLMMILGTQLLAQVPSSSGGKLPGSIQPNQNRSSPASAGEAAKV